ncbi:EthD domain-containing protein [Celeribacter naphthalenivorans]|uniref:EthD domain-containing protein n=1 Tax=Celeribacter naphthalenivorans TaxID=1614694 RepID=UPI001CFA6C54|nr:EthD domain-containing protein [Celeribacter naphthalenivorans]
MISRFGLVRRKDGMDDETFLNYWRKIHGPMAAKLPDLRNYYQNWITNADQVGVDHPRGQWDLDGFSELQFDTVQAMLDALESPEFPPTVEDVDKFLGQVRLIVCDKNVVVPRPTVDDGPVKKRISLLKRRPDVTPEQFKEEWLGKHAELVSKWPGVLGYNQNLVIDRYATMAETTDYDAVPVDGLVEFWFRTEEEVEGLFQTDQVKETQAHAYEFISEITTFFVEETKIF